MLFNFQPFIDELRKDLENKEIVEKYEKHFGTIEGGVKEQIWYKEYISKFTPASSSYRIPEELENDFDWDLFCQLTAAFFPSNASLIIRENKTELLIQIDELKTKAFVSALRNFQILQLHEIYCKEQMSLQILIAENGIEKQPILSERENVLSKWQKQLESIPIKEYISSIESDILAALD